MTKSISIKTPIPGPKSQALWERRMAASPRGVPNSTPIFAAQAEGALVTDVDGNTFIDFAGGIGVMNLGHRNPDVVAAIRDQLDKFTHTCFASMPHEPFVALAEKLNAITPGSFAKKTMFVNSGAEAVENAIKIARYATGRPGMIAFEHAFHGRTLLAMSLTSKIKPYKYGFGPFIPEIYRLPYPYPYRWYGPQPIDWKSEYKRIFDQLFAAHAAPDKIAALIIEPILGEGGFVQAPAEALHTMQEICRQHGIVFVVDEIQTGFYRTGKLFASEWSGIEPDIIVTAKSLASGLPLSAVTARVELIDKVHEGGLGGTYGGNPLACVAALATLDAMEKLDLGKKAIEIGEITRKRFSTIMEKSSKIGEIRGVGAMNAIEFVTNRQTKEPDKVTASTVQKQCYEQGLIALTAGTYSNVIRTLMPLVITPQQLHEGLDVLETVILALGN